MFLVWFLYVFCVVSWCLMVFWMVFWIVFDGFLGVLLTGAYGVCYFG